MTSACNRWCRHFFNLQTTLHRLSNNCIKYSDIIIYPFHDGGRYHIETSLLICGANK